MLLIYKKAKLLYPDTHYQDINSTKRTNTIHSPADLFPDTSRVVSAQLVKNDTKFLVQDFKRMKRQN